MIRLSFDQEAWSRGISAMPLPEDVRGEIERVLRATFWRPSTREPAKVVSIDDARRRLAAQEASQDRR